MQEWASVAVTAKLKLPGEVGVPDKLPAVDKAIPGGRLPLDTA